MVLRTALRRKTKEEMGDRKELKDKGVSRMFHLPIYYWSDQMKTRETERLRNTHTNLVFFLYLHRALNL